MSTGFQDLHLAKLDSYEKSQNMLSNQEISEDSHVMIIHNEREIDFESVEELNEFFKIMTSTGKHVAYDYSVTDTTESMFFDDSELMNELRDLLREAVKRRMVVTKPRQKDSEKVVDIFSKGHQCTALRMTGSSIEFLYNS